MINPFEDLIKRITLIEKKQPRVRCGTVTSTTPFKCCFDGETTSLTYLKPSNYSPILNDRVYFIYADGKYICLGKYE